MIKLNYLFSLLCTLAIGTFAFAQPANDLCSGAIDLNSSIGQGANNTVNAGTYDNSTATTGSDDPTAGYECFGEPDGGGATPSLENTIWFKVTGDGEDYSFEATVTGCTVSGGITDNDTQIAVYTGGCGTLTPVICNEDGPNAVTYNYPSLVEFTAEAGVEYLIMVDGFSFNGAPSVGEFCMFVTQTSGVPPPANDLCADAIDLSSSLGQGAGTTVNAGTYDNSTATTGSDDPADGSYACFGEPTGDASAPSLENTVWFKITGDGNIYTIEATNTDCAVTNGISDNDTQIAVYADGCGTLTPVACNEDGPNATGGNYPALVELTTEPGVEYLIMVDGFAFNGAPSIGEFCMLITQQASILCSNPDVGVGVASMFDDVICQPDEFSAFFIMSEALAPNEGEASGYVWVISTLDLAGSTDPVNAPGYLGAFAISPVLQDTIGLDLVTNMIPVGQYFATMYAFANATGDASMGLASVTFDPACTFVSNSAEFTYYPEGDPACTVGVLDVNEEVLGMTIFPNPAQDVINMNININEFSEAVIMVTNVMGQTIKQQVVNLQSGANTFSIDLDNAPAGVYMISVETDTHQSVSRFLKQ